MGQSKIDTIGSGVNPRMQCSVCGRWMRLHGRDKDGHAIQRFFSCCGANGEFEHAKNVCHKCCKERCPYRNVTKGSIGNSLGNCSFEIANRSDKRLSGSRPFVYLNH